MDVKDGGKVEECFNDYSYAFRNCGCLENLATQPKWDGTAKHGLIVGSLLVSESLEHIK